MTGRDDNERDDFRPLHGPSQSDIERFNREDAEYLDERKQAARTALWKLLAGATFILFAASMVLSVLLPAFSRSRTVVTGPERMPATVTSVLDGRTITVEARDIQLTVRYIGVETPLFGDPLYQVATDANTSLLLGRDVLLEADSRDTDKEGRLLRYVWIDGSMINLSLIASGLARSGESGENDRYAEVFDEAEGIAQSESRGIWKDSGSDRSAKLISPAQPSLQLFPA